MSPRRSSTHRTMTGLVLAAATLASCAGPPADDLVRPIRDAEIARRADAEAIVAGVDASDPRVRARAARALGRIQSPDAATALSRLAGDADPDVAASALFALGQLGLAANARANRVAVESCARALDRADPALVALAVECLGKQAPDDAASRLAGAFTHEAASVREQAAHAAMRLRFVPVWRGQRDEPPPWDETTVARLERALSDGSPAVRIAAAHALSRYGEPRAIEAIAGAVGDDDALVRRFAVRALGRSGATALADVLVEACSDVDAGVRYEAVAALDALGRADALPESSPGDPSVPVRARAARALGGVGDDRAAEALATLLGDGSGAVVAAAVAAYPIVGVDGWPAALVPATRDERWPVRAAAARTAGRAGSAALDVLVELAVDDDARVRAAAIEATVELDDAAVRGLVLAALDGASLAERGAAVARIVASAWDDRIDLLVGAYEQAGGVDGVEIRETIVAAVADDPEASALTERARSDPAPSVRALVTERDEASEALATPEPPPFGAWNEDEDEAPVVRLETTRGAITIRLDPRAAPFHVANLVGLVREGFYDNLAWHRVVPGFVIQGGDPEGTGWGGPGWSVPDEISRRRFVRGTVGMPKAGKDTGGCQIFITHLPTPHLDGNYTAFGQVVEGLDVIDAIEVGDRILSARVIATR